MKISVVMALLMFHWFWWNQRVGTLFFVCGFSNLQRMHTVPYDLEWHDSPETRFIG